MRVKGTWLLQLVKIIRSQKDRDWNKYLEPEDWEIINSIVVASKLYPYEVLWRIAVAVFKEIGESDLNSAILLGRAVGSDLLNVYKRTKIEGDPATTIENMAKIAPILHDYESESVKAPEIETGLDSAKITYYISPSIKDKERSDMAYYNVAGIFEEAAEQAGAKNIQTTIENKGQHAEIHIKWE